MECELQDSRKAQNERNVPEFIAGIGHLLDGVYVGGLPVTVKTYQGSCEYAVNAIEKHRREGVDRFGRVLSDITKNQLK
jgi:gamma-glutamylcysteine synthetase